MPTPRQDPDLVRAQQGEAACFHRSELVGAPVSVRATGTRSRSSPGHDCCRLSSLLNPSTDFTVLAASVAQTSPHVDATAMHLWAIPVVM